MLHPEVQVLNHGFSINKNSNTNFLVKYSNKKMNNFINEVLEIARKEQAIPREGGVITASHAFRDYKMMQRVFGSRYKSTNKKNIKSIVWKDSHNNTNVIMNQNFDRLISRNDKFRFLFPIRNPMDCSVSNAPDKNRRGLFSKNAQNKKDVLRRLFKIYAWLFEYENKYPNKFLHFFEFENDKFLNEFEKFACVGSDIRWKKDVKMVWNIKKSYNHDIKFRKLCARLIERHVVDNSIKKKFHTFLK